MREGYMGLRVSCLLSVLRVSFLQLLENLVVAMESEAQVIDISRVSGFMQKVRSTASIVMAGVLNVLLQVRNGVI